MRLRTVIFLILFALYPLYTGAQVIVLSEDFEDQDLGQNSEWTGDLSDFTFETENGNTLLRLDAEPDPTRTQIATQSTTISGSWQFYVRQDFNPSNFNRAFIFLMADRPDLNYLDGSSVNGYAIRTGDNQSPRRFKLVRFDGGNQTVLIESETEIEENSGYTIRVTRTGEGEWQLFIAPGPGSEPVPEGEPLTDQTHQASTHFGLLVRYSSGNTENFYFDNFQIENSEPFRMTGAEISSSHTAAATFSYPLNPGSVEPGRFILAPRGSPAEAVLSENKQRVILRFDDLLEDGNYTLRAEQLQSGFGDELPPESAIEFSFENPFVADSVQVRSPREVDLFFSEPPDPERTKVSQFEVSSAVQPATLLLDSTRVVLEFDEDLPQGPVSIELNGVRSINNWQIPDGFRLETFVFGEAGRRDVVLNELLYRRSSPDSYQFAELLNLTDDLIGLEGWELATERGSLTFPPETILQPGDYLLVADRQVPQVSDERVHVLPDFSPLRTTGDAVVLKNRESVVIDSMRYTPEWGGSSPGSSLERKDPQAISVDPANWAGSSTPTPLQPNRNFNTDTHPPQLLFAGYQPATGTILLRFDEFIDLSSTPVFSLNGLAASTNASPDKGNEILLKDPGNHLRESLTVRAEDISDHQGNRAGSIEFPVAHPVEPGDLVFNEIMFDPLEDDFDGIANQSEYIEIINLRGFSLSIEGVIVHGERNELGEISPFEWVSSQSKWIPALGRALIYPEPEGILFEESRTTRYFDLSADNEPHSLQANRSTLSLTTSGGTLFLADSLLQPVDSIRYDPAWHNPNLMQTKGVSLERVSPEGSSSRQNWGSSTAINGGTPLAVNSIRQWPETPAENSSIHLEPNPFSPDNDGEEDRLFIRYSFDDPNYMLRTRIYDRHGRLVRSLSDSSPSGFEGNIIWDGRMENGVTCRIGIYIVHIEAYNASTGSRKQFKEPVVLARRF